MLAQQKAADGIVIANTIGQEYFLYKDDGREWLTGTSAVQPDGTKMLFQQWSAPDAPLTTWQETGEYDPRKRPWFTYSHIP